jgi:hypothetical protein
LTLDGQAGAVVFCGIQVMQVSKTLWTAKTIVLTSVFQDVIPYQRPGYGSQLLVT